MIATSSILNGRLFRGGLFNGGLFSASPNRSFITTWDTTKAGVTGSTSIRLPLVSGEVYNFLVDWGDGSSETVAGSAISSKDHTYSVGGIYTVTISGTFPRIYFNDGGDKLKLLTIENLGSVGWTSFYGAFHGCSNNTKCAGTASWNGVTNLSYSWAYNSLTSWNTNLPISLTDCSYAWRSNSLTSWTINLPASLTTCQGAWYGNSLTSWTVDLPAALTNCAHAWRENSLTSWTTNLPASLTTCAHAWRTNSLTSWNTDIPASVTDCSYAWRANSITSWTVDLPAALTNCAHAWRENSLTSWTTNLPISLTDCSYAWRSNSLTSWTINLPASLTNCSYAWYDNNITSWTGGGWANVTDATDALAVGANAINTTDYNALLVAIEANNQNNNVPFHFGGSKHSGAGTTARAALIADHADTITDGGAA